MTSSRKTKGLFFVVQNRLQWLHIRKGPPCTWNVSAIEFIFHIHLFCSFLRIIKIQNLETENEIWRFIFSGTSFTVGGNHSFKSCTFPFEYKGVNHDTCITQDSPGTPWCATERQYSESKWGYCDCPFGNKFSTVWFFW